MEDVRITVGIEDLARSLHEDEARAIILAIEKRMQDCDFTLNLLREIISSLKDDMPIDQIAEELGFAMKPNPVN